MGPAAVRRALGLVFVVGLVVGALAMSGVRASRLAHSPVAPQPPKPAAAQGDGHLGPAGTRTLDPATPPSPRFADVIVGRPPEPGHGSPASLPLVPTRKQARRAPTRPRAPKASTGQVGGRAALTLRQWCLRFLAYLGAPAKRADDPRVTFLERWAMVEATFARGNQHNPLDTEMPEPGAALWNAVGVRRYSSLLDGFRATRATMELGFNRPILLALRRHGATMAELALALAKSNWTGHGPKSWREQGYASEISGRSPFSFGLPEPTVSLRGTVVGPYGHPRGGVCVAAAHRGAPVHRVETAPDGTFALSGVPRTRYRLELTDCGHGRPGTVWFYDARAKPNLRTVRARQATTLGAACAAQARCPDEHIRLHRPIEFGRTTPPLSWTPPVAITYGTGLSRAELDATAGVKGTFHYRPPLGTRLSGGLHELHAVFEPANTGAFTAASIARPLSVHAAPPRLTWTPPGPIRSTTEVTARELDATASVPGTMGYSVPHGIRLSPGRHVLKVTFVPANPHDYGVARAAVILTVLAPPASRSAPAAPIRQAGTKREAGRPAGAVPSG